MKLKFKGEKDDRRTIFNDSLYEPIVVGEEEPLSKERFYQIVEQMD